MSHNVLWFWCNTSRQTIPNHLFYILYSTHSPQSFCSQSCWPSCRPSRPPKRSPQPSLRPNPVCLLIRRRWLRPLRRWPILRIRRRTLPHRLRTPPAMHRRTIRPDMCRRMRIPHIRPVRRWFSERMEAKAWRYIYWQRDQLDTSGYDSFLNTYLWATNNGLHVVYWIIFVGRRIKFMKIKRMNWMDNSK